MIVKTNAHPLLKALLGLMAFVFLSITLFIGGLYYLSSGEGFSHPAVTARLENLLNDRLPRDIITTIGTSRFQKREGGLKLTAENIVFLSEGKPLFTAPKINLMFDPVGFITSGAAENPYLSRVEVEGATFNFNGSKEAFNPKIIALAFQKINETSFVSVQFKQVNLQGRVLDISLNRLSPKKIDITLNEAGRDLVTASLLSQDQQSQLEVSIPDIQLSTLKDLLPQGYNPERVNFTFGAKAKILFNEKGEAKAFQSSLSAYNGTVVKLGKNPKTYDLNRMNLAFSWVEGRKDINIDEVSLDIHPYKATLKGVVSDKAFLITEGNIAVAGGARDPIVTLSQVIVKGMYDLEKQEIIFERAELSGMETGLSAKGKLQFTDETPGLYLDIETKPMPSWVYLRLWPEVVSTKVRQWVMDHVKSGNVGSSLIKTAIPPGQMIPDNVILEREMLFITTKVMNGIVKPLNDLGDIYVPLLNIHVDGKNVMVESSDATLNIANAKPLNASYILFNVPDTGPEFPPAILTVKAKGEAQSLAVLLKSDIFKGISAFTLEEGGGLKGQAATQVRLMMDLKASLKRSDVKYKAEIDFTNFAQKEVVRDLDLEAATVKVIASSSDFSLKGEGKIGGQQASFDYKKTDKKPFIELKATLDEKGRTRFGLASGGRINGVTPVKIQSLTNESDKYTIEVDFTQAYLNDLIPGWVKPVGVPAKAKFKANDLDPGWQIDDIFIEGRGGVFIKGSLEIDGQGQLISGNFPNYNLRDGDKASVKIDKILGGHRVLLTASVIDLRAVMKNLLSSSAPVGSDKSSPKGGLTVEAKVGAAAGNHGEMMRNIYVKASRVNGEITSVDASGRIGRGGFKINNILDNKKNWLTVTAGDAGAWLRFFNVYSNMQGGEMRLALAPPKADGSIEAGAVEISDFVIRGDEAIGGMVATSEIKEAKSNLSLEERQRILSEKLRERGGQTTTSFVRMKGDFSKSAGQIITVRSGLIWGAALGSTIEGTLDFNKNQINMAGTYVPAYALNNIFAKLPIIGFFLGGNSDEGLIGVNYTITGSTAAPILTINPLSILAPGFLRRMLDFRGGENRTRLDSGSLN